MSLLSAALRHTGRNMANTWKSQLTTLFTVSLSILIFSFFYLAYFNGLLIGQELGDDLRLIVYLDEDPSPPLEEEYRRKIEKFDQVESITFVSRQQAFASFSRQLGDDRDILLDLPPDFLPPSIQVSPIKSLDSLSRIKRFSDYLQTLPGVLRVQYGKEWIERFYSVIQLIKIVVILSGCLLIMTTTFMVAHTIRLTLLSRQKELELLRLVGATNNYIRMPFLLEGGFQGLLGSGLGMGALYLLYRWLLLRFSGSTLFELFPCSFLPPATIALLMMVATLLCALGSFSSTRKTLRF
ncbi:cell division protein FtsX [Desulfogranum mediterraneum]|uniref:cell division protein FtsX n=1 Tax=Desulfogranum mediterraneum TaxID=160661 RepID=UPI000405ECCB|nr:ABC transporter permease [Desulfogranum mediterraneum]